MQDMGNTKARLLYEANLPENFRRPQTDQYPLNFVYCMFKRVSTFLPLVFYVRIEEDVKCIMVALIKDGNYMHDSAYL